MNWILKHRVTADYKRLEREDECWDDFTPELWAEENLKYLRRSALPFDQGEFVYDVNNDCFKFQGEYKEFEQDEEFIFCAEDIPHDSQTEENIPDDESPKMDAASGQPG